MNTRKNSVSVLSHIFSRVSIFIIVFLFIEHVSYAQSPRMLQETLIETIEVKDNTLLTSNLTLGSPKILNLNAPIRTLLVWLRSSLVSRLFQSIESF